MNYINRNDRQHTEINKGPNPTASRRRDSGLTRAQINKWIRLYERAIKNLKSELKRTKQ